MLLNTGDMQHANVPNEAAKPSSQSLFPVCSFLYVTVQVLTAPQMTRSLGTLPLPANGQLQGKGPCIS